MGKDRELVIYGTIQNYPETVKLTALWDCIREKYVMPSIEFDNHEDFKDEFWDNDDWIFGYFYDFLKRWKSRTITMEDIETDLYQDYKGNEWNEDRISDIIDIIEQALELNWYKPKEDGK